jgi:hypothetical protein
MDVTLAIHVLPFLSLIEQISRIIVCIVLIPVLFKLYSALKAYIDKNR